MKKAGVYIIESTICDGHYWGETSMGLKERMYVHFSLLRSGKHQNNQLQEFVDNNGIECLTFRLVCEEPNKRLRREIEEDFIQVTYETNWNEKIGMNHTKEWKKENSERMTGKKNYFYKRRGQNHPRSKPVIQVNKEGTKVARFESAALAEDALGIHCSNIGRVANGEPKYKTAGGFIWIWEEDWDAKNS